MSTHWDNLIRIALEIASSVPTDDLPIAAVILDGRGQVVASGCNSQVLNDRVGAHAELLAIQELPATLLKGAAGNMTLVVTLEPCPMCAWAIRSAGIGRVIFGAYNPNYGAAGSVFDLLRDKRFGREIEVIGGVLELECQELLRGAFRKLRDNNVW